LRTPTPKPTLLNYKRGAIPTHKSHTSIASHL
jgi:hypothetical protein